MKDKKRDLNKSAWITWEVQVRNRSMSSALNVPLFELTSYLPRLLRYPVLIYKTCSIILKHKIKILFVQNPSIVLSFLAICLKPILRLTVVVDAHNSGIFPLEGRSHILNLMARLIIRQATCTIITNEALAGAVRRRGGDAFIMPDPIPDFSAHKITPFSPTKRYAYFICTWADDEPYEEVLEAASLLSSIDIDIYVTGNYRKRLNTHTLSKIPQNVKLLGFVSESDYLNYFAGASLVLDLTTRENCLVCGAYEALALRKPAIISDSAVNRDLFKDGFVYTQNDAKSIRDSIEIGLGQLSLLEAAIIKTVSEVSTINQKARTDLIAKIGL